MASVAELDAVVTRSPINLSLEGKARQFTSFTELRDFVQQEHGFWSKCGNARDLALMFNDLLNAIVRATQPSLRPEEAVAEIRRVIQNLGAKLFESSGATAAFLTDAYSHSAYVANYAYRHLIGGVPVNEFPQAAGGVILAFLYANPWVSSAPNAAEVEAFRQRRTDLDQFRESAGGDYTQFRKAAEDWKNQTESSVSNFLKEGRDTFESQRSQWDNELRQFKTAWEAERESTKKTYDEQIKLSEPAKYWADMETKYQSNGEAWAYLTAAAIAVLASLVVLFVYNPPDLLRSDKFTLSGFKGAVLIGAGVSMFVYLVSFLAKFATSSFHLARDARERCQLTHVYLALIKDNAIPEESRNIVLTALFSRSDTGLLKSDATPSLPLASIIESLKAK